MKQCKVCNSKNIKIETTPFNEDSDNIFKVFVCLDCGYKEDELINIQ